MSRYGGIASSPFSVVLRNWCPYRNISSAREPKCRKKKFSNGSVEFGCALGLGSGVGSLILSCTRWGAVLGSTESNHEFWNITEEYAFLVFLHGQHL